MDLNLDAISASIPGKIRGRKSTTSTSAPRRDHTVPISSPIYPAPTTTSFFGNFGISNAPVEETICFSSIGKEARLVGSDPVAIRILSALNSPLSRPVMIVTTPCDVIWAEPTRWVILFFAKSWLIPLVRPETISDLCSSIFLRSSFTSLKPIPSAAR